MSVIELHPEELFDRLSAGTLTEAEGERLRAHLETCEVCRLELALRADFSESALAAPRPAGDPKTSDEVAARPSAEKSRAARVGLRFRPRALVRFAAAALLLVATGAFAAVWSGTTTARRWFGSAPEPTAIAQTRAPERARLAPVSSGATTPLPAPSAAPSPSAEPARPAEPSTRVPTTRENTTSPAQLFSAANRARSRGESARAIALYRRLQRDFPGSSEAVLSELTLAALLLHQGDGRGALAAFDGYLARAQRPLEAEALVGRAVALSRLGQTESEVLAWRRVLERDPESSYAERARERLSALGQPTARNSP